MPRQQLKDITRILLEEKIIDNYEKHHMLSKWRQAIVDEHEDLLLDKERALLYFDSLEIIDNAILKITL